MNRLNTWLVAFWIFLGIFGMVGLLARRLWMLEPLMVLALLGFCGMGIVLLNQWRNSKNRKSSHK